MCTLQPVLARIAAAALVIGASGRGHAAAPEPPSAPPEGAETEPASTDGLTTLHVIEAAGNDPRLGRAVSAARARLHGQGVELVLTTPGPDEPAARLARTLTAGGRSQGAFWFDERTPGELRVFLITADGSAYVRRVPVEEGSAEASLEAVWLIVEASSLALASGQRVAMEQATGELEPEVAPEPEPEPEPEPGLEAKEPAPKPEGAPEPVTPTPDRVVVRLGLGYLGEGLASAVPWSSGAAVDVALDLGRRWRLALGYGLLLPWRSGDPPVTWRHRAELRAGPRVALGSRVELYALLGGGLEALRWHATAGDEAGHRVLGVVTLDGGLGLRLVSTLRLVLEPGSSVVVNRFDFVECAAGSQACEGAARRVVLAPWRVRPRARLGLQVSF